jgi:autotransporter-associated beta strand protein
VTVFGAGGTTNFNAPQAYTGATNLTGGTLKAGVANAIPSTSAVVMGSNTVLDTNGFAQSIGSLASTLISPQVIVSGALTVGNDNTSTTYAGSFTGSAGITKVGTGTLALTTGSITYTGPWNLNGGVVSIAGAAALGGTTNTINFNGGTLRYTGPGEGTGKPPVFNAAGGTIDVVNAAASLTLNGALSGSGEVTKAGDGTLGLNGSTTFTGRWNLNGGALSINDVGRLGSTTTNVATFNGGTLRYTHATGQATSRSFTVDAGGGTIDVANAAATLTINLGITNKAGVTTSGALIKTGPGTLAVAGTDSYNGGTIINGGTFKLAGANPFGLPATGTLTVNTGGTFDLNGKQRSIAPLTGTTAVILDGGTIADSAAVATAYLGTASPNVFDLRAGTVSGRLGGSGAVVKTSAGTVTMIGASEYTGTTTVQAGTLVLGADVPSGGNGALGNSTSSVQLGTVNSAATDNLALLIGGPFTMSRKIAVNALNTSGTSTLGGNSADAATFAADITLNRATQLTAAAGGTVTFAGIFGGTGAVSKVGAGTVVLSNTSNSWGGGTTISEGTVKLGANNVLPGAATVATGGTLDLAGFSETIAPFVLDGGTLANSAPATGFLQSTTGVAYDLRAGTVNARLGGLTGSVVKTTAGTVAMNVQATYGGGTTVSAGTLQLGHEQALGTGGLTVTGGLVKANESLPKAIKLASLGVTGGQVDLTNNRMIVVGGDAAAVSSLVASGRNGGAWNGAGVITSEGAAASGVTSLGVVANSALNRSTFGGVSVGASDVLVMYTYAGDADLNGKLNGDDYFRIDSNINVPGATGWYNGDFDYNGHVNGDDYFLLDANLGRQTFGTFPTGDAITAGDTASVSGLTVVPEPASLGLVVTAACGLAARRRRSGGRAMPIRR